MSDNLDANREKTAPTLRLRVEGNFAQWLEQSGGSLLITTYTSGKLVLVSSCEGRLQFRSIAFPRPMGIAYDGEQLALAVRKGIVLYGKSKSPSDHVKSVNRFRQRCIFTTGRLDTHDLAFGSRGLYLVNTRFNCIARASQRCSFLHTWRPSFIQELVGKDHCHLNGLGMRAGKPAMVTAFSETDHARGWRTADRFHSGVIIDIEQNEVVARGLCMPHSPRFHHDSWWLCNSGLGALSRLDTGTDKVEEVCQLPGFTRGLCFVGDHALVGMSRIRPEHVLDTRLLREQPARSRAGVALVNLASGREEGILEFVSGGREVYEVLFLPSITRSYIPALRQVAEKGA